MHCVQKQISHFCFLAYVLEKLTNLNEKDKIGIEMIISV